MAVFVVLAMAYLALTFANPRAVPRVVFLPKPTGRGVWYDTCDGKPLNRHSEIWKRGDLFWTHEEFSTLAGCLSDLKP